MSLSEYIEIIREFGSDHKMVRATYFGLRPELEEQNAPVLWFYVNGATILNNQIQIRFIVSFMDVMQHDLSNEADILSDTKQLCEDFLAFMEYSGLSYGFQFDRGAKISPFVHAADSDYAGHEVEVSFNAPYEYNYCDIPLSTATALTAKQNTIGGFRQVVQDFCDNHKAINYSRFTAFPNIDDEDANGIGMHWFLAEDSVSGTQIDSGYRAMFLDVEQPDTEEYVYNACLKAAEDFLGFLWYHQSPVGFQASRGAEITFRSRGERSNYSGVQLDFRVLSANNYDVCNVPMDQMLVNEDWDWVEDGNGNRILVS